MAIRVRLKTSTRYKLQLASLLLNQSSVGAHNFLRRLEAVQTIVFFFQKNGGVFWFFATPIIYPMSMAPSGGKRYLDMNPFTHLAVSYQEILFYDGPFGHLKWLLTLGAASIVLFLVGYFLFDRLRDSFAEEV